MDLVDKEKSKEKAPPLARRRFYGKMLPKKGEGTTCGGPTEKKEAGRGKGGKTLLKRKQRGVEKQALGPPNAPAGDCIWAGSTERTEERLGPTETRTHLHRRVAGEDAGEK